MQEWLAAQIAQGFPAFTGAALSGTIPVKEELINELIARFLAQPGEPPSAPAIDMRQFVPFVKAAAVHAEPGVVKLTFELRI